MEKILFYPQDATIRMKTDILNLQSTAWYGSDSEEQMSRWPDRFHKTSICLYIDDVIVCHVGLSRIIITHKSTQYICYGINEVVTHPLHKNKGFALKLLKIAYEYVKNRADFCIFTCNKNLSKFYNKAGFDISNVVLVGGIKDVPFRSDTLNLQTMIKLFSDKAVENKDNFYNTDVFLELGEKILW